MTSVWLSGKKYEERRLHIEGKNRNYHGTANEMLKSISSLSQTKAKVWIIFVE